MGFQSRECRLLLLAVVAAFPAVSALAQENSAAVLTPQEIIQRVRAHNRDREQRLESYSVRRRYHLWNEVTNKRSELEVEMTFRPPGEIEFRQLRQSGSAFLARRVFGGMMEAEKQAFAEENRPRAALSEDNYTFAPAGEEVLNGRRAYILEAKPKRKDTYLIEGKVWIDAEDFAVVKIAGRPAKKPSIWTRRVDLVRAYRKVGPFWFADRLETISEVLIFGQTRVGIESGDYQVRLRRLTSAASPH